MPEQLGGVAIAEHGTYPGWNRHMLDGERACAACRAFKAEYQRAWRIHAGVTQQMPVSISGLCTILRIAPELEPILVHEFGRLATDALLIAAEQPVTP